MTRTSDLATSCVGRWIGWLIFVSNVINSIGADASGDLANLNAAGNQAGSAIALSAPGILNTRLSITVLRKAATLRIGSGLPRSEPGPFEQ